MKALLTVLLLVSTVAAEPTKHHVIVLDVSKSMRPHYRAGLRDYLLRPMLESSVFQSGEKIILRGFDRRKRRSFLENDPQRYYYGAFDSSKVLAAVPAMEDVLGAFTSIPEGLDLAVADIDAFGLGKNCIIYLITDNWQDETGSGDDPVEPFYQKMYGEAKFKNIYFFPIVRDTAGALVMYVLNYSTDSGIDNFPALMEQLGKAIGHRPILFRPIRLASLELDRGSLKVETVEGELLPAEFEDARVVFAVDAGSALSGKIMFRLRSRFKEWRIDSARVSDAVVMLDESPYLLTEGQLRWKVDPKTLEVAPQQTTQRVYVIDLASGGDILTQKVSFLESFFVEPVSTVKGEVVFKIEDPAFTLAFYDDAELTAKIKRVRGLEHIERFLLPAGIQQADKTLEINIPIVVKIRQPVRPLWMLVTAASVPFILLVLLVISFMKPKTYKLVFAGTTTSVRLKPLAYIKLRFADKEIGELRRTFSGFKVELFDPFVSESGAKVTLPAQGGEIYVSSTEDNKTYSLSIEPVQTRREGDV
ncbi:MAG: hypothetical protein RMM17_10155 [Acidobacteriota bacterium]|nr:hypothetical protein [Acidobacteriota bacterium]